mgnify:CR=1 FL=1
MTYFGRLVGFELTDSISLSSDLLVELRGSHVISCISRPLSRFVVFLSKLLISVFEPEQLVNLSLHLVLNRRR